MADLKMNAEYFSGSQASIFIGDIWVDDIVDWQCSLGANAKPIYGYGSTFYDHAAQGRVLVQGSFTINFREPNYLFAILARYNKYKNLDLDNNRITRNPYSPEKDLKELSYQDKRKALDNFFSIPREAMGDASIESIIRNGISDSVSEAFGGSRLGSLDLNSNNDFAIPTFDIKIGYGATLDENTVGEQIVGVKLLGKGKVIMANGEPIKESYSFFARNII